MDDDKVINLNDRILPVTSEALGSIIENTRIKSFLLDFRKYCKEMSLDINVDKLHIEYLLINSLISQPVQDKLRNIDRRIIPIIERYLENDLLELDQVSSILNEFEKVKNEIMNSES